MYKFRFLNEKGEDSSVYVIGADSLREAWGALKSSRRYSKYKGIMYEKKV